MKTCNKETKDLSHIPQRLPVWDLLKLFAIFLVIWGHSITAFSSSVSEQNPVFIRLNGFHVGLFMMISGYFSLSAFRLSPLRFLSKKFYQLVYPCFAWGGVKWIIIETALIITGGLASLTLSGLLSDLYWFSDFWFLKSCFLCFCIAYLGHMLPIKSRYWMPLTVIVSQVVPPFSIPFMYPCFLAGMVLRKDEGLMKFISLFHNAFTKACCSPVIKTLSEWGRYTLELYIVQHFVLEQTLCHFIKFDNYSLTVFSVLISPVASVLVLLLCLCIIRLIYQSRTLSKFLFAKEPPSVA
ncbi:MAG: acyltransferase [Prevotella sp.]|nr:acyltransferase [Prevotella sp.]